MLLIFFNNSQVRTRMKKSQHDSCKYFGLAKRRLNNLKACRRKEVKFFLFAVNEMLNLSINRLQLFLSMDKCSHYEHHIKRNRF